MYFRIDSQPVAFNFKLPDGKTRLVPFDLLELELLIEEIETYWRVERPGLSLQVIRTIAATIEKRFGVPMTPDGAYRLFVEVTSTFNYLATELDSQITKALKQNVDHQLVINGHKLKCTMFALRETVERLENKFEIVGEKYTRPTVEFLQAIVEHVAKFGVAADITVAWAIWQFVTCLLPHYAKYGRDEALLARWYGVDPFQLSDRNKLVLLANVSRLKAIEKIDRGKYDAADPDGVYGLFMAAYGNKRLAAKMKGESIMYRSEKQKAQS